VLATWDTELSVSMKQHQLAIPEEGVAASLVQDLEAAQD
jgi:hypothetical protein